MRLTGARVLAGGELRAGEVTLGGGRILPGPRPDALEVDLSGYLVLPGVVDLYGGAFERHAASYPQSPAPLAAALLATDREAAANGVTTAHLCQGWSWEGGHRDPARAEALLAALDADRAHRLTDLRAVLRIETHTAGTDERLVAAVERHRVGFALFGDRLTGSGLSDPARPAGIAARAAALGIPPEDYAVRLRRAAARAPEVPRHVLRLAEAFDGLGVTFGSEGDRDGEAREAWSMRGARLCVFPAARAPAASARAVGDRVVLRAAEVARLAGPRPRAEAPDLVEQGLCDALASDMAYPALAAAAFRLADDGAMGLARAWSLVSEGPARCLGLSDRGRIEPGLRADLCVVDPRTRVVEATLSAGRVSHLVGGAATRLLSAALEARRAA
jgi:alpha-D-ribose 1-methylphosphonate 5-triphosphate diphosphatase